MVEIKHIPTPLVEYYEKETMCSSSVEMLNRLREKPDLFAEEIAFLEENISQLDKGLREQREEMIRFIEPLKFDFLAWFYTYLHYICAMQWNEIVVFTGNVSTVEAAKARVYRALRKVYGDGELTAKDKKSDSNNRAAFS